MSRSRFARTIGLGMTIAALGASSASARPIDSPVRDAIDVGGAAATRYVPKTAEMDLYGSTVRGAVSAPTAQYIPTDVRTPDSMPASKSSTTAPVADLRTPDARDHGQGRGTFNAPEVSVVKVADPTAGNGFDWVDAGIGAGGLLGMILLGLGGAAAVAHRKATPRATTIT